MGQNLSWSERGPCPFAVRYVVFVLAHAFVDVPQEQKDQTYEKDSGKNSKVKVIGFVHSVIPLPL